jgi:aryl-alcohol dehydrogenase-like predicted oxidoreductase
MRWILMQQGVSAVIPGAKRPSQVEENAGAADLAPIAPEAMKALSELYESRVKPLVHHKW